MVLNIEEYINNSDNIHAHIKENKKPETLKEHLDRSNKYYKKMSDIKGVEKHVKELINHLTKNPKVGEDDKVVIYKMFVNAIYLHDIGKINPKFQRDKMKNTSFHKINEWSSEHSLISALIYIDIFKKEIENLKSRKFLEIFLYSFAYEISRHHTYLQNVEKFEKALQGVQGEVYYEQYKFKDRIINIDLMVPSVEKVKRYEIPEIEFYILNKLLYSLIVSCDYYATYEYMNGEEIQLDVIENAEEVINKYKNTEIYKSINEYKSGKEIYEKSSINKLRTDIFLEAEKNLRSNLDKDIFYLEAPTGSGKTNTSINLALNILERTKEIKNIFYIFPFNTITEQTAENFNKFLENEKDFMCINSITPIANEKIENAEEQLDYNKIYLNYQFMHYPIVLTSHVNLFSALFGTGREASLVLSRFCNSVIIIDEIQNYRNDRWREMIIFFKTYAKMLNIKIIIMSATLPKLDMLLKEKDAGFISLIENKNKYFKNPLFKNRVGINTELLNKGKVTLEDIYEQVREYEDKKVLIEFIRKKTAREFYNLLKERINNIEIIEITGDDNKYYRQEAIEKIKKLNEIIIIATQTIEAGVDIDTDIGFKDISLIESEEQFIGRINRSSKKENCIAYFFDKDDASGVYKEDIRTSFNIKNEELKQDFINKDFDKYYEILLIELKNKSDKANQNNINVLYDAAGALKFEEIERKMRLIEQATVQVFFNFTIKTNKEELKGKEVWENYKEICMNQEMGYSEKQIKLSQISQKMNCFLYNVDSSKSIYSNEKFGNIYYVENGEEYVVERKI